MSQSEFLKGILPEGTRYSLRLINSKYKSAFNKFFDSPEDMADAIQQGFGGVFDTYYVTAGLGAGPTASSDNAVAKRELYVDIDCGENKPYKTKEEGVLALRDFCKAVGMPQPTLVDSGNGLHAHWIFIQSVAVHEWLDLANRLKALCKEKHFEVDSVCTADVVRVLRVPGTVNSKNGASVTLLTRVRHYDFNWLKSIICRVVLPSKDTLAKAKELSKGVSSNLTKSLAAGDPNRVSVFQTIWMRSAEGNGCAQMKNARVNSATLSEPLWRAALSIAQHCEDRDWAVHEVSKNHPDYDPQETEYKSSNTKGPYTCESFQKLDAGHLCSGCAYADKITSPIQLGTTIKIAPAGERKVVEYAGKRFEMPPLPVPYVRGQYGGIYMQNPSKDDGTNELELIYPHDLYVYKRMRESDLGDVVWMRHHLPNDGVRDFMVPQKDVGALDRLRDKLSEQGVAAFNMGQLQKLQSYIAKSIQELQYQSRAEDMHIRFGWTPEDTFIIGDREYTKKGIVYAPVSRGLEKYVKWFTPKGSLDEWKKVMSMYEDEAFDLHAFGILAGFGSVFMRLSPENGAVLNYYSKQSGTGKTTILRAVNSIFGDPRAMMKDAQDTHLTKVHRMGVMNGMPVCVDEMTNARPEELSSMLYGSTQGRARDRMKAGENAERTNDFTWKQLSIWSTNAAIEDRLGTIKLDPQGEMARVVEIYLRTPVPSNVLESQKMFNKLNDHYGHAGHIFMSYYIPNMEQCQKIWDDTRDVIYSKQKWTQVERYRLNAVICTLAAGVVTNALGLTNFNLSRIGARVVQEIKRAGDEMRAQATTAVETFATFVNRNINNMLSIDSSQRAKGLQNEPHVKPKGTLVVRYEPDTKSLFIVQRDFTRWCGENFLNAKELPMMFEEETGKKLAVIKKRMGAGWDTDFGAVNVYCIPDAIRVLGLDSDGLTTPTEG